MVFQGFAVLVLSMVPGLILNVLYARAAAQAAARGEDDFFGGLDAIVRGVGYVIGFILFTAAAAVVAQRWVLRAAFPWWADLLLWLLAMVAVLVSFATLYGRYEQRCSQVSARMWD